MLSGHRVVHPADSVLQERPEAFNRVRVNIAAYVYAGGVVDPLMRVSAGGEALVGRELVGVDHRLREDSLLDVGEQFPGGDVIDCVGGDSATPLDHSEDGGLVRPAAGTASGGAFATSADVRLVQFDGPGEGEVVVEHDFLANQLHHSPGGLVGDTDFTFQLLGGDSASGAGHEVHGVEPQVQGSGRLVVDRPCGGVDVGSAGGAGPRLTLLRSLVPLEAALLPALLAEGVGAVFGVAGAPQPVEAGGVVGEVPHEFHEGVVRLGRFGSDRVVSVYMRHTLNVEVGCDSK